MCYVVNQTHNGGFLFIHNCSQRNTVIFTGNLKLFFTTFIQFRLISLGCLNCQQFHKTLSVLGKRANTIWSTSDFIILYYSICILVFSVLLGPTPQHFKLFHSPPQIWQFLVWISNFSDIVQLSLRFVLWSPHFFLYILSYQACFFF